MLNRHRHTVSSWIAIFAVLLNALMPTVSVALDDAGNKSTATSNWIEICSTKGSIWVRLALDGGLIEQTDSKPINAPASIGHCAYCVTHAASFGLPPTPAWVLPVWALVAIFLPQTSSPPNTSTAWFTPAARAPPPHINV